LGKEMWIARLAVVVVLACSGLFFVKLFRWPAFLPNGAFAASRYVEGIKTGIETRNFYTKETDHFVIKFMAKDKPYVKVVADTAEEVWGPITRFFGYGPREKTVVVIYPDSESLGASFGWDKDEEAMGVYWAGSIRVLSPGQWIGSADTGEVFRREGPLAHELTHLLVDELTKGNYPRWFTEGIAQYVERKVTGFSFAEPYFREIPHYSFEVLESDFDNLDQRLAYWESLVAVDCIVDRVGEEGLLQLIDALGSGLSLPEAVKKVMGIEFSQFAREVYFRLDHNLG